MRHDKITPYKTAEEKKEQVATMFNNIANRYDLLNGILSLGIHKTWRKKCVELLAERKPKKILDVATGTGDFAIECVKLKPDKITGIDVSDGMLDFGKLKIRQLSLDHLISLEKGDAETIDFPANSYDAIVVGFGVRNFQDLEKGLLNMQRMLKPGGQLVVLEFSYPRNFFIRGLYNFYFSYITPFVGKIFSKDKRAYSYLTESVKAFPNNADFVNILNKLNFRNTYFKSLSLGVASIYYGEK